MSASAWGSCGESVENHTVLRLGLIVDNLLENAYHQRVGDKLTLVDVGLGNLPDRGFAGYMVAEHLSCGDVVQPVVLDKLFTLCAFPAAGGTEYYNIHFVSLQTLDGPRRLCFGADRGMAVAGSRISAGQTSRPTAVFFFTFRCG